MRLIRLLKTDIAKEASDWVKQGFISKDQAEQICAYYGIDYQQRSQRSFGYTLLVCLGYLFLGLALIILIGENWENIPRALRMGGLLIITLTIQLMGLWSYQKGDQNQATGLFLLGNICYGATIILIAQIYHLGEHMPSGIFWWALGTIPFTLLLYSPWLMLLSGTLALIWLLLESSLGFYPLLYPVFIIAATIVLVKGRYNSLLFLITILGAGAWLECSLNWFWQRYDSFSLLSEHLVTAASLLVLAYAFSHYLNQQQASTKAKDYGALLRVWSLRAGVLALFILSFEQPWRELIQSSWNHLNSMVAFVFIVSGISLALAWASDRVATTAFLLTCYWLALLSVIIANTSTSAPYLQIADNILLIGVGIWLIVRGIQLGVSNSLFLGITILLLTALIRYIDLVGDYIGGAILFTLFAAMLLGAAKYWAYYNRQHKEAE